MRTYPVHYDVVAATGMSRIQLFIRFVAFVAIGLAGFSSGSIYAFGFFALPIIATFVRPAKILRAIHWYAAISAWMNLTTERIPEQPEDTVTLTVDKLPTDLPTPGLVWRVLVGLPSAIALCFVAFIGSFVWLWAAITVLFAERVGAGAHHYLVGMQRWSVRLLAYQAGLVDEYPPFSFDDVPVTPALPTAAVR
jgi:hypothetical protein